MQISIITQVTDEIESAFQRLIPQLSTNPPPTRAQLEEMVASDAVSLFIVRDPEASGKIIGALALAVFRVPTGRRAWIEDVIVDEQYRGKGLGEALTRQAMQWAAQKGAQSIELTSRPAREAANRLYQRLGFQRRETNLYHINL